MMDCIVCSASSRRFKDEKTGITYTQCDRCGLISKNPECFQDFASQKERYDLHENDAENVGYRDYFQRFLEFVLPQAGEVRTALDFGCGASTLLADMLAEEGIDCDYYDPIYAPDDAYRRRHYDLILSVEVFEHLHRPDETFTHLVERLNPGGFLAIRTEFHPDDIERFLGWYYRMDSTHVVFFRPETFRYLAQRNGCLYLGDNGKNMLLIQKSSI
jgi:SAM-dependent methyltransferase